MFDIKVFIEIIEVIVIKCFEFIQDVLVVVFVLSGDVFENMGIDNFQDYVEFLFNVVFQGIGLGQNEIYICGVVIMQLSIMLLFVQVLQFFVVFYQDEMLVFMVGCNLDIYVIDVQCVEVLFGL